MMLNIQVKRELASYAEVNIHKFTPQVGSSYIKLPSQIRQKKACINVKNNDQKCFVWAVISALYPAATHSDRPSSYPDPSQVLNLKGINFPMTLKQIPRFEKQNNLSINVYILKKKNKNFTTEPTYLTKAVQEKHVNLLLLQDKYYNDEEINDVTTKNHEEEEEKDLPLIYHFVWIKNLSRLLSTQLSNHKSKNYFCNRCLHFFYDQNRLDKHFRDCIEMNDCKIRLPTEENKFIKFKNYKNKVKTPFVIYADLECLLVPRVDEKIYQEHQPCSIGYYVKCSYDDTLSFYRSYRGEDCIEWFSQEIAQFAEDVETVFLCPIPMDKLTPDEKNNYHNASICHICEKSFTVEDKKAQDHDHLTGKYRGPAHEGCNINYQDSHTVPVVFHNLSGYDSHFIIKNLATNMKGRTEILAVNKERYISFTLHLDDNIIKFRFIDSFRFMASSLDTLASYLKEYPEIQSEFSELNETKLQLLTRKGVYPYDYFDSHEKFCETTLPDKIKFYNQLNESEISDADYQHAQTVWNEFKIQNLGEYSDLYLKTDVLLLACVFEEFRNSCWKTYGLDPSHYFTLPGYTWDCMLKHINVSLELMTDIDMSMFIERGIRGGLSQCSLRYARANNKYMPDYDSTKASKYLIYNDLNNQYGWAMSQYLPYGDFKWNTKTEDFDVMEISDEANIGYILEVDLEYPQDLHDAHSDLPFCPEHRCPPAKIEASSKAWTQITKNPSHLTVSTISLA